MQARREEQPRQIPVFGKESQEASKQEKSSSDWSSEQSGLGLQERSKQHQQEWEEQSRRRQWESEKGIGDTYGSTGTTGQGLGQQYEQQFEKGQFDKGFGGQGVGGQQSEQGLGVGQQYEKGQFDKGIGQQYSKELGAGDPGAQQFDKGYQQESDYGQKSHEWKQKTLAKDPEQLRQYGEKPFEEVQGGKKHHVPIGSGESQTSHSDWGVTGQQEREQQLQSEEARNKETCKSKEITGKEKQICPKEKEKEACQYKEPCSTHQKAIRTGTEQQEDLTKTQKQEETSGALPVAQPVGEKGEQTREGKDEEREERQRHKLDPKLKEEIEQCKDSRFNNIMQLMHTTKAKALLDSHKPLVTVSDSTSINEALVTLNENDLSSAPILNHEGEFLGFIDMLGITGFTMCLHKKLCQQKGISPLEGRGQQQKLAITRMEEWKNETVGSLISKGHLPKDHYLLHGSSSLYEAFELMARTRQHRIALTSKRNEVIGVLTQSMMMEFLYDHKKDLEAVGEILVLRLRPYTFLATVKEDEPAVHAFETMAKQKVSGLAVVNKEGQLVDGISVRDLRGVCSGAGCDFNTLHKSVKQFRKCVTKAKKEFKWTGQLAVKNEENFETVLEKLVKLHAHRVFVIDREQKPVDVITGSSIMAMVLHCAFPPSHWGPLT